jgi:uncharacterized glyoxalase superfamily protein PhnB
MAKAKAIPEGMHTVTAQLRLEGAAQALDLYAKAFGAEERGQRAMDPSGKKVWHAELKIGDSIVFVNDPAPEMGAPAKPAALWLYVDDVDAAFARATGAGLVAKMPPADMFWGDRMCKVDDRFGVEWNIATHVKDLTPEEMKKAEAAFIASMKK